MARLVLLISLVLIPTVPAVASLQQGDAQYAAGQYNQAIAEYRLEMSYHSAMRQRYDAGTTTHRTSTSRLILLHTRMARAYEAMGDPALAIEQLQAAARLLQSLGEAIPDTLTASLNRLGGQLPTPAPPTPPATNPPSTSPNPGSSTPTSPPNSPSTPANNPSDRDLPSPRITQPRTETPEPANGNSAELGISGDALYSEGLDLYYANDYLEALDIFQSAADVFQAEGDQEGVGLATYYVGLIYEELRQFGSALEAWTRAIQNAESRSDSEALAIIYYRMGTVQQAMGNFNEAQRVLNLALEYATQSGSLETLAGVYFELGLLLALDENWREAYDFVLASHEILESMDHPDADDVAASLEAIRQQFLDTDDTLVR